MSGVVVVPLRGVRAVADGLAASPVAHGVPDALRKVFALADALDHDLERVAPPGP